MFCVLHLIQFASCLSDNLLISLCVVIQESLFDLESDVIQNASLFDDSGIYTDVFFAWQGPLRLLPFHVAMICILMVSADFVCAHCQLQLFFQSRFS